MSYLDNIVFSAECQDFIIEKPIYNEEFKTLVLHSHSRKDVSSFFCPHCKTHHIHQNMIYTRSIKSVPFSPDTKTIIRTEVRSFECQECGRVFSEEIPFLYPKTRLTQTMASWIKAMLSFASVSAISKMLNVNWNTVKEIHKELVTTTLRERRSKLLREGYRPRYLGVDEFAIHKGHRYATVVMDIETGEVLWVGKDRTIEAFSKFFEDIEKELLEKVEAVAMDMNASYHKVVMEHMKDVAIVYDRYHMESNYGRDVMGVVRLDAARQYDQQSKDQYITADEKKFLKKQYSTIKRARWMLLAKGLSSRNQDGTWSSDIDTLQEILNKHQDISLCYAMKEELSEMYLLRDEKQAEKKWNAWFRAAEESEIPALVKFAKNKKERLPGLIAHALHPITTGKVEGTNNKIKVLKRVAYGFRDDDYFFSLIRYSTIPRPKDSHK